MTPRTKDELNGRRDERYRRMNFLMDGGATTAY